MIWSLALAAPVLEENPLDKLQSCIEGAGPIQTFEPLEWSSKVALLVGVPCHDDPGIPSLQFSTKDAERMAKIFAARGFNVRSLTTRVTREEFYDALEEIDGALAPDGELVVYYSGHGVLRSSGMSLERYLVFSDADLGDIEKTGVSLTNLEARIQKVDAGRRVMIQDSCYASGDRGKGLGGPSGSKSLSLPAPPLSAIDTRFYASRFYELATEEIDLEGSVYTSALVKALDDPAADIDGDACVGLSEAHALASSQTTQQRDGYQHPEWDGAAIPSGCAAPTHAVIVDRGTLRPVEPGIVGKGDTRRRVRAGEWVRLMPSQTTYLVMGVRPRLRAWNTSFLAFDGEAMISRRHRSSTVLGGFRAGWSLPREQNEVTFRGGDLVIRAGLMTNTVLALGVVGELGVLLVRPEADGGALPLQTAGMGGAFFRSQVATGPILFSLEIGSHITADRSGGVVRPVPLPGVAAGLGVRL